VCGSVVVHGPLAQDFEQCPALGRVRNEPRLHALGEKDRVNEGFAILRRISEKGISSEGRFAVTETRAELSERQLCARFDEWSFAGMAPAHGLMVGVLVRASPGISLLSGRRLRLRVIAT
jgi:hypothetical protein